VLLAVDTSTRTTGIALYDGARVLGEAVWHSEDYHSVELAPAVAGLIERSGAQPSKIAAIAIATGPGSFTGLRIGMAFVKGLAFSRHVPLVGIPSLDFLAAAQPVYSGYHLAAVLKAGRGRLAVGWYQANGSAWKSTGDTTVMTIEDLSSSITQPTMICGELSAEEQRLLRRKRKNVALASPAQSIRRPSYLAELAWRRWQLGKVDDPATISPIYLHYNAAIPG
jgi:tRNA threonylcarbamoyladenosine biosynthesis protein TsaB